MHECGLKPDVMSYSVTISACTRDGEWENSVKLLQEMNKMRIEPDTISLSAAITACARCGQWEKAMGLLAQMRSPPQQIPATAIQRSNSPNSPQHFSTTS